MSYPITISRADYVGNATFRYRLGKSDDFANKEIAIVSASIPFSWYNISAAQGNNTFQIIHPTTAGSTTLTITIKDGGYEISDLNAALRASLINQGYFIQNTSTQDQTVYCELRVNASTYSIEFVSYPLPTSLPSGFTAGSAITFPASIRGPQLIVPSTNIRTRFGFAAGTFPASAPTTLTVVSSTTVPIVNDVSVIVVQLDSCYNPYSANNQSLTAIAPSGTAFSRTITYNASELIWCKQQAGTRQELTLRLVDQFFRAINITELDIVINLVIRDVQK
jgi:hypothetical protein